MKKDSPEYPVLTGEQILAIDDLPTVRVPVPEWKATVIVRTLSGSERDEWEGRMVRERAADENAKLDNIRATLCALAAVDEKGTRLWSELDAARIGKKSSKALDRVYAVAKHLSGIGPDDIKELVKNSESGQSEDSGSN